MSDRDRELAEEWLRFAEEDLAAAELLSAAGSFDRRVLAAVKEVS